MPWWSLNSLSHQAISSHDIEYVDCVGFVLSEYEFPLTNLHVPFLCEGMVHNVNSSIHVIGIKNQLIKG